MKLLLVQSRNDRHCLAYYLPFMAMLALCGCSKSSTSDYVPAAETAKEALTAALDAWQKGQAPARITTGELSIQPPQDFQWKQGRKLASYQIIAEQSPPADDTAPRKFSVKLTLAQSPAPIDAVYYVVGKKEDMWVYREQDYQRATGG
jgi:hypothetical protein